MPQTGFCSSGSDLNVHCFGKSASPIGEFINKIQFLSIHSDCWFIVRLSRYWLVFNLSICCADCKVIVIT